MCWIPRTADPAFKQNQWEFLSIVSVPSIIWILISNLFIVPFFLESWTKKQPNAL